MVADNSNKFSVMALHRILLQTTVRLAASTNATFISFRAWLYCQTSKYFSKITLFLAMIIVIILSSRFHYSKEENMISTIKEYSVSCEIYQLYLPKPRFSKRIFHVSPGILIKNATKFQLPKICSNTNAAIWKTCGAERCIFHDRTPNWTYPRFTVTGEKTEDFINRVLEIAWGQNPPSIDLYWRTGCHGIMEMKYLLQSIEIFWPRFLGSVVVVLDAGDEVFLKYVLPKNPTHHYVVAFEHLPCLPGRVFNQYSYLNLDRHCMADYVVTIDSDCVFHSPVTPDLIFRSGKIILASSRKFHKTLRKSSVDAILNPGLYDGHCMVTQPVVFALSTFSSFRKWFHRSRGVCYEDKLATISPQYYYRFCWMCQLGTYLQRGNPEKTDSEQYWYHDLDEPKSEPIIRYSAHLTYEQSRDVNCPKATCYEKNTNEIIKQGLCRAFGLSIFHACSNYLDFSYVNEVTFSYGHQEIQAADKVARANALRNHLLRLSNAIKIASSRNTSYLSRS